MNQGRKDWSWVFAIACTITAVSTVALITSVKVEPSSPIQNLNSVVSYLGAPGGAKRVVLALLIAGSYGTHGTFVLIVAALVNLVLYTLGIFGAIRQFRAVRKRVH